MAADSTSRPSFLRFRRAGVTLNARFGPMEHLVQRGVGIDVKPVGSKVVIRRESKKDEDAAGD